MNLRPHGRNNAADAAVAARKTPKEIAHQAEYRRKRINDWCGSMRNTIVFWFKSEAKLQDNLLAALELFHGELLKAVNVWEEVA